MIKDLLKKEQESELLAFTSAKLLSNVSSTLIEKIHEIYKKYLNGIIDNNKFIEEVNKLIAKDEEKKTEAADKEIKKIITNEINETEHVLRDTLIIASFVPFFIKKEKDNIVNEMISKNPYYSIEFQKYNELSKKRIIETITDIISNSKNVDEALIQLNTIKDINKRGLNNLARTMYRAAQTDTTKKIYKERGIKKIRFVAIVDDATTNICLKLDGMVFNINDCPTPPLHYNCRSVIVALTDEEAKKYQTYSFLRIYNNNSNDKDLKKLKYGMRT